MCVSNEKFLDHHDAVRGMPAEQRAAYLEGLVAAFSGMVDEETWDAAVSIAEKAPGSGDLLQDLLSEMEGDHVEEEARMAVGASG